MVGILGEGCSLAGIELPVRKRLGEIVEDLHLLLRCGNSVGKQHEVALGHALVGFQQAGQILHGPTHLHDAAAVFGRARALTEQVDVRLGGEGIHVVGLEQRPLHVLCPRHVLGPDPT